MNKLEALSIRRSGRSWWEARYSDRQTVAEWDTLVGTLLLPLNAGKSSRWEDIPKDRMVGLRLLCPNGMAGELEAPEGHRFLQLKYGGFMVGSGQFCEAHIIGVVRNIAGDCLCRAWEYRERRLIEFEDNIFHMKYRQIGQLSLAVQGLRV